MPVNTFDDTKLHKPETCECGKQSNGATENQETADTKLKDVKDRYMSSFTMHALNHIVEGTRGEKIMWTLTLLTAVGLAVYLAWNFFVSYFNYEVSTTFKNVPKMSMKLPIMYLCRKDLWQYLTGNLHNCLPNSKHYDNKICTELRKESPVW